MTTLPTNMTLKIRILFIIIVFGINGCGGGGGGGGGGDDSAGGLSGGWVTILSPTDTGETSTYCNTVSLSGEAFISKNYHKCCTGIVEEDTGVTVSWENQVTSTTGDATQNVSICQLIGSPYLCYHTWRATIPLALGDNIIKVKAIDSSGAGDSETITVFKPEYSYTASGILSTYEDIGLGYFQSGVTVELTNGTSKTAKPSSYSDIGKFTFVCIPNGSYTIEPITNTFNYALDPEFYSISVTDEDVFDLDFYTTSYAASGMITYDTGTPVNSGVRLEISNGESTWSRIVQSGGIYSFVIPNGSYTITPSSSFCFDCTFTPTSRAIEVVDSSITGLDFIYNP